MVRHEVTVHETLGIKDFIPIVRGRADMADALKKQGKHTKLVSILMGMRGELHCGRKNKIHSLQ